MTNNEGIYLQVYRKPFFTLALGDGGKVLALYPRPRVLLQCNKKLFTVYNCFVLLISNIYNEILGCCDWIF